MPQRWLAIGILLVVCAVAPAAVAPVQAEDTSEDGPSLATLGLRVEEALRAPDDAQEQALRSVARALAQGNGEELPDDRKNAARLLSGIVEFSLGEFDAARSSYDKARKEGSKGPFADDAALAEILAIEGRGDDAEAEEEWREFLKKFKDSPLRGEARLALLWNQLRQGQLEEARHAVSTMPELAPWMLEDPRWAVAEAMVSFMAGDPAAALTTLERGGDGPAVHYLEALCHDAHGDVLKAAANYQEVAERHPGSPLRDHALLAKANAFLDSGVYRSAIEEFQRVLEVAQEPGVRAEASLRHAAAVFMDGEHEAADSLLRAVVDRNGGTDVAARAQFLLGEVLVAQERFEEAIVEYNRVLTSYFEHSVAASAQYRVGRCLDAIDRPLDATSAYQAVVAGYPLEPEAPAAAYLAGAGLLQQDQPRAAAPYLQVVLDRYTATEGADGTIVFASPEHHELAEAALCLLELAYHRAGDLGQLSGAPHLLLQRMPPSRSAWRAYALLIDADALAAQGRHEEAQQNLQALLEDFPGHPALASANQLLAWSFAMQGKDELAIEIEENTLKQFGETGDPEQLATAHLHMAHVRFNRREYGDAVEGYEAYLQRFPTANDRLLALYQAGLCYLRLGRNGDAVDRWETLVAAEPAAEISEKAWARAGDLYFNAQHYDDARRCYQGLLDNFAGSSAAAAGMLRLAQCAYNAGDDAAAIEGYSALMERYPYGREADEAERGLELALYRLGQAQDGAEVLSQLVERYPGSAFAADAQFQIAKRLFDAGSHAEAAEEFRRVVSQFPGSSSAERAQFLMGDAYAQAGDLTQARLAFEQFLTFFVDSDLRRTVQFRLGSLYFEQKDYVRTAMEFTRVLEYEGSDELTSAALFNLALCQRMMGSTDDAIAGLLRYREQFGDDDRSIDVAYQLGEMHESAGRLTDAVAEYTRALAAKPGDQLTLELAYRIGTCHEHAGDRTAALESYEMARKSIRATDPFRLSALARMASMYEELEHYGKALSVYRDLAKNSPDPELSEAARERAAQLEAFAR